MSIAYLENILILNSDVPLLGPGIVRGLLKKHKKSKAEISFVSSYAVVPTGYGRVVEVDGKLKIYEENDCPEEFKDTSKVNAGIYVIKKSFLERYIRKL